MVSCGNIEVLTEDFDARIGFSVVDVGRDIFPFRIEGDVIPRGDGAGYGTNAVIFAVKPLIPLCDGRLREKAFDLSRVAVRPKAEFQDKMPIGFGWAVVTIGLTVEEQLFDDGIVTVSDDADKVC